MTFKKIKKDIQIMDMKEFSKAIRCIIRFFLSEVGCVSILTSERKRPAKYFTALVAENFLRGHNSCNFTLHNY